VFGRYYPFYREGFYRDDRYVPVGRYEGDDYGAALSASRLLGEGFRAEIGGFYRRYDFSRTGTTAANYIVPDDYNGYGGRIILEHDTLVLERRSGRPDGGFLFTILVEREQNDSERRFGTIGIYETTLPSGLWRGHGHLEWFFPHRESSTFALFLDGSVSDEKDRVYNYDATKPIGNLWFDAKLQWRWDVSQSLSVAPFGHAQYVRVLEETGFSADNDVFLGGGVQGRFDLGDSVSVLAIYSYLDNENRETVSPTKDTMGEHQVFAGLEVRFGAERAGR
jgi:hypothetical protein